MEKPELYKTKLLAWWEGINPEWRERHDGQMVLNGTGDWGCLMVPGINGFLSVLIGLVGYHDVATHEKWVQIATDVSWALSQILDVLRAGVAGARSGEYVLHLTNRFQ